MPTPPSDPDDLSRRSLLQESDQLLEEVEILRLDQVRRVPPRLSSRIETLQLEAGRGEASIAPATLRTAHEIVLSVQYRLMSGNPRNGMTRTHLGRGAGQAAVRAIAGGGSWKHLVLPAPGTEPAEWRALVEATLDRALDRWAYAQHHAASCARERSGAKQALARARTAWLNYWELAEEAERLGARGRGGDAI